LTDETPPGEPSGAVRARVIAARRIQQERLMGAGIYCNSQMQAKHIRKFCHLNEDSRDLLRSAAERLGLSGRAYDKILKISRTIADLAGSVAIGREQVAEAIQYRSWEY
jgi:magnesium chelatase family protein